jgi:uncharacterized membrane protein YbhN (UPF0104 family)
MNWRNILKYTVFLGVGVLLFSLAFSLVDDKEALWEAMRSASWSGIGISFVMGYLAILSRGLRWGMLLEPLGHRANVYHSIHSVAFAYFANTFVPRSGELARCAALNQTDDIPVDQLFGTVISERVIDLIFLVLLTGIAVVGNLDAFAGLLENAELPALSGAWPFGVTALVAMGVLFKWRESIGQWSLIQKAKLFLKGVTEGLMSIKNMQRKGAFLAHSFFIWFMYFGMAWVIFKSIDAVAEITVLQALFIMVAGGFGMIIPAPGGIGAYHGAVMLGFVALGYNEELGLAVANVIWLTQTLMIVFTGGVAYLALMWYRIKKDRLTDSLPKTTKS